MASVTNRDRDMRDNLKVVVTSRHASGRDIPGQCHAVSRFVTQENDDARFDMGAGMGSWPNFFFRRGSM